MKSLMMYLTSFLLITSCQSTNITTHGNIYSEGLWRISNHKGNIKVNEMFRYMSLDVSNYTFSKDSNCKQIFEVKNTSPVKQIEIDSLGKGKELIQEIVFRFSPEYCLNVEELNSYNWSEKGAMKSVPVHVMNNPPTADSVFFQKIGHKFVLAQKNGLETTVMLGKKCAKEIFVDRLWQPM